MRRTVLAIDPGNERSAIVLWDRMRGEILLKDILGNAALLAEIPVLARQADDCVIEMIASYGMAVGREVFETCVFIGRLMERWSSYRIAHEDGAPTIHRLTRRDVKLHICASARATDANIRTALVDHFGGAGGKAAIGTKKAPGPLYGVTKDAWAALALAMTFAKTEIRQEFAAPAPAQPEPRLLAADGNEADPPAGMFHRPPDGTSAHLDPNGEGQARRTGR